MSLSLVSLNCEGDRHLDRVRDFLIDAEADAICLQEVFVSDAYQIGAELGYQAMVVPHDQHPRSTNGQLDMRGIAILSKTTPQKGGLFYYHLAGNVLPVFDSADRFSSYEHCSHHAVLWVEVADQDNQVMQIGTLHHTVVPKGVENEVQTRHTQKLLAMLAEMPPMVLCGDFNIPRGYNTNYKLFVEAGYADAIPKEYTCSLDPLHRAWKKVPAIQQYMVDYVWTPKEFVASDVTLVPNISDHRAVVGEISRW